MVGVVDRYWALMTIKDSTLELYIYIETSRKFWWQGMIKLWNYVNALLGIGMGTLTHANALGSRGLMYIDDDAYICHGEVNTTGYTISYKHCVELTLCPPPWGTNSVGGGTSLMLICL